MRTFIFDIDGTLTPSRQKINKNFENWFEHFATHNAVYYVTGSDRNKTLEQIGHQLYNLSMRVYQCSGNDVWERNKQVRTNEWKLPDDARQWLLNALDDSDFGIRTGNHIEQRVGMANFSIVGRNATQQERKSYVDYEAWNSERRHIADLFNADFPHLEATVGGETGIDIAPKGADKSQILKDFNKDSHITFFGDAIYEGGNDWPLALALTNRNAKYNLYKVSDWTETWKILKEIA